MGVSRRHRCARCHLLLSTVLMLCLVSGSLFQLSALPLAAQHTPTSERRALFVGHLNGDAFADTVKGSTFGGGSTYLPELIFWGRDTAQSGGGGTVAVTQLLYPVYPEFSGSVTFLDLNPNDTLTDMLFFLWGTVDTAATEPDTGRAVVIFGQPALSTISTISIDQIGALQTSPFVAQDVAVGIDLVEPAVRDLSDVESYRLEPLDVTVVDTSGSPPPKPIITLVSDSMEVRIYPNPSLYTATIEADLPAGSYTARVIGVNGQVYNEQDLVLETKGTLWRTLDVGPLASGYYIVQILRDGSVAGAYPFIIRR